MPLRGESWIRKDALRLPVLPVRMPHLYAGVLTVGVQDLTVSTMYGPAASSPEEDTPYSQRMDREPCRK